jgi:hypothetical protein
MKEMPSDGESLAVRLKTGDHIIVYESSGRVLDMRFVLIEDHVLRGSLVRDGQEAVEVRLVDIRKIEAERVAVGRTTGAVLGGAVLLPIAAMGAGVVLAGELQ